MVLCDVYSKCRIVMWMELPWKHGTKARIVSAKSLGVNHLIDEIDYQLVTKQLKEAWRVKEIP